MEHKTGSLEGAQLVMEKIAKDENSPFTAETENQQNYDAPISRLPHEILVHIFMIYKNEFPIKPWHDGTPLWLWHRVTHVCKHWRHVALHAASLWNEPPTEFHNYTLLMLERSRQSPLSIHLHFDVSKATQAAVLQHVRRIDRLILDSYKDQMDELQETLSGLSHDSFSQLRELHVIGTLGESSDPFELSPSTFRHASSLKMLSVEAINFDWQLFPIPTLTCLHLYSLCVSVSPSWRQFQDILRGMPLLEDFLFSFDDLRIHTPPSHLDPLSLPFLRQLDLRSSCSSVTQAFIYSTKFTQRLQQAAIACSFSDPNVAYDYSPTIRAVLSLHTMYDFGPFEFLYVTQSHFWVSPTPDDELDYANKQELHLRILWNEHLHHGRESARFASDTMSGIVALPDNPASNIVHLSLSVDLSPNQFVTLFGYLPRLETISADYSCLSIVESLEISPLHPPDLPIPFVKLKAITLNKCGSKGGYSPALLEKLSDCLMMRYEYGAGIDYVFIGWKLTAKEAQHLREIVVNVDIRVKRYVV